MAVLEFLALLVFVASVGVVTFHVWDALAPLFRVINRLPPKKRGQGSG
jgi:hypothetical protein